MKIGLICPYNMARGGGVRSYVLALCDGLRSNGHDVKIISPTPLQYDAADPLYKHVIFIGNGTEFRSPMQTVPTFSASVDANEIETMLEREKFDILHFHEPWVPVLSRQIASRSRSVNIATFHAQIPETIMSRTIAKVVTPYTKSELKYLHALTAVSDAASEYVSTLTDEPITIIPNGIDLKSYKPKTATSTDVTDDTKTILYVGRLENRKGVKYLLQAFAQLVQSQDNVSLVIAGDGPNREKLEQLAADLALPNVSFLGYVDETTKLELLRNADLFCSPAMYGESFGIVLLEAMACGTVTIAGDNVGYRGVMQETGALSLLDPKDTNEFARRLKLLLNEEPLRNEWKKWAKRYVKQFDYPAIIKRYEDLYEYAIQHHRHKVKALDD